VACLAVARGAGSSKSVTLDEFKALPKILQIEELPDIAAESSQDTGKGKMPAPLHHQIRFRKTSSKNSAQWIEVRTKCTACEQVHAEDPLRRRNTYWEEPFEPPPPKRL
jgi:hypothetical protein